MSDELSGLIVGTEAFLKATSSAPNGANNSTHPGSGGKVTLSIGATPTATSIQNILDPSSHTAEKYTSVISKAKESFNLELHAGVYTVNDLQQIATRARPSHLPNQPEQTLLSHANIALRILAVVASDYPDRTEKPEALIAAGSIALGREPCKSYPGWGVVTPWPLKGKGFYDPEGEKVGWIVGRISQEHGILSWEGEGGVGRELKVGEKVCHICSKLV